MPTHIEDIQKKILEYVPAMEKTARKIMGNNGEADEAVQAACLKLLRSKTAKPIDAPQAYVNRSVHNTCQTMLKQKAAAAISIFEPDSDGIALVEKIVSGVVTPAEAAESEELQDIARRMIAALPLIYMQSLHLHYYLAWKYAEIAGYLHITESAVKQRVHRGIKMLRKLILLSLIERKKPRCSPKSKSGIVARPLFPK